MRKKERKKRNLGRVQVVWVSRVIVIAVGINSNQDSKIGMLDEMIVASYLLQ